MNLRRPKRRGTYFAFIAIQAAGVLCFSGLPGRIGNFGLVSLLAGMLFLFPGSIISLMIRRAGSWTSLAPSTLDMLMVLAAVAMNCAALVSIGGLEWRRFIGRGYRLWLLAVGLGNLIAGLFMWLWWPSAGMDVFNHRHVLLVSESAVGTALAVTICAVGLLIERWVRLASWTVVIIQFLRLAPASRAMQYWPGGDDGPGLGWAGIVTPFAWLLAIAGAASCTWCSMRHISESQQPSDR